MLDKMVIVLNLTHNLIMHVKISHPYKLAFKLSCNHNFYKFFVVVSNNFFAIKPRSDVILLKKWNESELDLSLTPSIYCIDCKYPTEDKKVGKRKMKMHSILHMNETS